MTSLSALVLCAIGLVSCGGSGGSGSSNSVRVASVSPNFGPFIGGTAITIKGQNFVLPVDGSNTVAIGGRACANVIAVDASTLTCTTPSGTPGVEADVVVTNANGSARFFKGFRYLLPAPVKSDLNGDGVADLVVSAPQDDTVATNAGAVFVFFGAANRSALHDANSDEADVKLVGQKAGDSFGSSVACGDVDHDGNDDLVVGANLVDGVSAVDAGAAYVFYGPLFAGATISAAAADVKLSGETIVAGDRFGSAVEAGDVTGDDTLDLMVAATLHDRSLPGMPIAGEAGCVYVFGGGAGLVSQGAQQAPHKFDGNAADDRLGNALACGDLSGDGVDDIVVGCQFADPQPVLQPLLVDAGATYVLLGGQAMQGGLISSAIATLVGEGAQDQFGNQTCVADVNGDGLSDLIASAWLNDAFDADGGRVYVFFGGSAVIPNRAQDADAILSGHATHNTFGKTVAVGDVNGDSISDVVIGAPQADFMSDNSGRVYGFVGGPNFHDTIASNAQLVINGESIVDYQLGASVALLDFDGDGLTDIAAASTQHASGTGRVFLFLDRTSGGTVMASDAELRFTGRGTGALFGASIANGQ